MNIRSIKPNLLFAALALAGASTIATAQEDANAAQQKPMSTTSQPAAPLSESPASNTTLAQTKFDLLDSNHDGSIDKTEAAVSSALIVQFDKIDSNHDGKLSLTEFAAIHDLASIKADKKGYQ